MPAVARTNPTIGYTTVTIQPTLKASCATAMNTPSRTAALASANKPDLRAPMATTIPMTARISATSTGVPTDLSGRPASTVHSALALTSTAGIGTDEIDVTNTSLTGSVTPMSTTLPANELAETLPASTSTNE